MMTLAAGAGIKTPAASKTANAGAGVLGYYRPVLYATVRR